MQDLRNEQPWHPAQRKDWQKQTLPADRFGKLYCLVVEAYQPRLRPEKKEVLLMKTKQLLEELQEMLIDENYTGALQLVEETLIDME
jgi:hypothetical protein